MPVWEAFMKRCLKVTLALACALNSLRADRPQSEVRGGDSPAEARDRFSAPRFMHPGVVSAFAYSPDGKFVVPLTAKDTDISICDAKTGAVVRTLKGHELRVNSVAYSSDGKWLVSGSDDQTIRIWDVETGKEKRVLDGHHNQVKAVALSADDKVLASLAADGTARIWD